MQAKVITQRHISTMSSASIPSLVYFQAQTMESRQQPKGDGDESSVAGHPSNPETCAESSHYRQLPSTYAPPLSTGMSLYTNSELGLITARLLI